MTIEDRIVDYIRKGNLKGALLGLALMFSKTYLNSKFPESGMSIVKKKEEKTI